MLMMLMMEKLVAAAASIQLPSARSAQPSCNFGAALAGHASSQSSVQS